MLKMVSKVIFKIIDGLLGGNLDNLTTAIVGGVENECG